MAVEYRVRLTQQALNDIDDINDFIGRDSPANAVETIERIFDAFDSPRLAPASRSVSRKMMADRDTKIIERLLAVHQGEGRSSGAASADLIRRLASMAPKGFTKRSSTLFEAINVLNLENPHSDFLAWMLCAEGPLPDGSLLRLLFETFVDDEEWPGVPESVEREVECDDGRADIVVSWPSFTLVIENKVWSPTSHQQISCYLKGFDISKNQDGRVEWH